jgi:ParB/RepB/Spo0J family partition protein
MVPIGKVKPNPNNPRTFSAKPDQALVELSESIKMRGVLVPLIAKEEKNGIFLCAGERRLRAATMAKLKEVPVLVSDLASDADMMEVALVENLQRQNLTPMQELSGVEQLAKTLSAEDVSAHLGRSIGWVRKRLSLANLTKEWRTAYEEDQLEGWSIVFYERIARFPANVQCAMFVQWTKSNAFVPADIHGFDQRMSDFLHWLPGAPWKITDAALLPDVGACDQCPKRSSCQPDLFADLTPMAKNKAQPDDRCLDVACWNSKTVAFILGKIKEIGAKAGRSPILVQENYKYNDDCNPFGGKLHRDYNIAKLKKTDAGAVPCLWVDGPKAGSVFYGYLSSHGAGASASSKGVKKTPTEKREGLDKRRQRWAVEQFVDEFKEMAMPAADVVLRLVAAFGTWDKIAYPENECWKKFHALKMESATTTLWEQVRRVLIQRMDSSYAPQVDEAREVAAMMSMDFEGHMLKAIDVHPEPKSWHKETAAQVEEAPKKRGRKPKTEHTEIPVPEDAL